MPPRLRHWFASPPVPVPRPAPGWRQSGCRLPLEYARRIARGYYPGRSPDIIFVPREPNFVGEFDYTTHGGPWAYLQRVPLVLFGPGFIRPRGEISLDREVTVADLAPTVAELLDAPFPGRRPGRPIHEALVPEEERVGKPKVVLTLVWDGGGTDVLETWPGSLPHLRRLIERGTSVSDAVVGSAPSVTPPVHTTIGTGAWPAEHGIVDLTQRDGDRVLDSFGMKESNFSPRYMELTTLADIHDLETNNRAEIGMLGHRGWHLGMMGKGSYLPGADKDIAAVIDRTTGRLVTGPSWYELPGYLDDVSGLEEDIRAADTADGRSDSKWMGRVPLEHPGQAQYTPAWTLYQTRLAKAILAGEEFGEDAVPDMFFVNYKQIDDVGHFYNMLGPEMREILRYSDAALGELTAWLDSRVGEGQWVLAFTADHGESPEPEAVGAWPIDTATVQQSMARHFGVDVDALFQNKRTMGFWVDHDFLRERGIALGELANFLLGYRIRDMVETPSDVPEQYRERLREPVFQAAWPGDQTPEIWECARQRAAQS